MKSNFWAFINKKIKTTYRLILATIFFSTFIFNGLIQIMSISISTLNDDLLQNNNLSLIVMQNYDDYGSVSELDIQAISELENVVFISRHKILGLAALDEYNNLFTFWVRSLPIEHSYFVGIDNFYSDSVFCPIKLYGYDIENSRILDVETDFNIITYNYSPSFVVGDVCFTSIETYAKIYSELPADATAGITPEYLIAVDDVRNVFEVVRELERIGNDSMILFQAHGLENIIGDISILLIVLVVLFIVTSAFSIYIIFFLSSILIGKISRDLMILYLNGISRSHLSKELSKYLSKPLNAIMGVATLIFLIVWMIFRRVVLQERLNIEALILASLISIVVILLNSLSLKIVISKLVKNNTSNDNISKIIRN